MRKNISNTNRKNNNMNTKERCGMKRSKKITAAVLSALMLCGTTTGTLMKKSENTAMVTYAAASSFTKSQGAQWAIDRAKEGWQVDYDGVYGCQCIDLIQAYGKYLGEYIPSYNAYKYADDWDLPSGWTKVTSNPQPGDLFVQKGYVGGASPYGHVGIVVSNNGNGTFDTVETNAYGNCDAAMRFTRSFDVTYFIRPNFKKENLLKCNPVKIDEGRYMFVNVGNGGVLDVNWGTGEEYMPLCTWEKDGSIEQEFQVKYEHSTKYSLQILYPGGGVVNSLTSSNVTAGTAITSYPKVEDDTEKFYFHKEGDHYYIFSAANTEVAFTASKTKSGNDARVVYQTATKDNKYQQWKLVRLDPPVATTTTTTTTTTTSKPTTTTTAATTTRAYTSGIIKQTTKASTTTTTNTTTKQTTTENVTTTTAGSLIIEETKVTLNEGEKHRIKANQTNLTYKSNDEDTALVSDTGVITAMKSGTAIITVINSRKETETIYVTVKAEKILKGDANCDGSINMSDAVSIMQSLSNPDKYKITERGKLNADVTGNDGMTVADALEIQRYLLGLVKSLG